MDKNKVLAGILGLCIGDALGVPFEFKPRGAFKKVNINMLKGYGTHNQPPGTWSDDSSLTLCLIESLVNGYNINDIGKQFCRWLYEGFWTPHGKIFDIGNTTKEAIKNLGSGVSPIKSGNNSEFSNGNGSLMRILPLVYFLNKMDDINKKINIIHEISGITHNHIRSKIACAIYVIFGINLLNGLNLKESYCNTIKTIYDYYTKTDYKTELLKFSKILFSDISKLKIDQIKSTGYVVDTLEAAVWCLLKNNSFTETVLSAIELGDDTDTTGAVAGGLAGIYYGLDAIPENWLNILARKDDIIQLIHKFYYSLK